MIVDDVQVCDRCGDGPAPYALSNGLVTWHHCERCAIAQGWESHGQAYAALKMLGFAASLLRDEGVSDALIEGALHDILTDPHGDGSYPVGGDHVALGDDCAAVGWKRPFTRGTEAAT